MKHYQAMGVVVYKLLRIIYGVLKHKTTFNAQTDELNQKRSAEKQENKEQQDKTNQKVKKQKRNRFQEVSPDEAPISRRKEQK